MRAACATVCLLMIAGSASGAELGGTAQASGKPVASAIVWLDAPNAPPLLQTTKVVLDQRHLDFEPHVLAVRVGTVVDFPNDDHVFHNVFSFRDGKKFDLGLYPAGSTKPIVFDRPGLSRIFCNIHPHMAAYVMAVATPYFATADEHGVFSISGIPAGTYTYHAWRPGGETLSGSVTVGSSPARQDIDIKWP